MVLVDTSAVYAFADVDDPNHVHALSLFQTTVAKNETLLTHSYLISETVSLLQRRLGMAAARAFLEDLRLYTVHWIDPTDHQEAAALLLERNRRSLSLVDCASFVVMRRYRSTSALYFDDDFEREGIALYSG